MASHLERELSNLKKELIGLGTMVENSVRKVILAKEKNDQDLAKSIILKDKEIDQREIEIEEECLKLLALYQPVAVDLRLMVSILKINFKRAFKARGTDKVVYLPPAPDACAQQWRRGGRCKCGLSAQSRGFWLLSWGFPVLA